MLQLSKEELQEMSFVEIAFHLLNEKRDSISFFDLLDEIAAALELSDEEKEARMAQFYTDLNIDGRFIALEGNRWGLREWFPIDQVDDEVNTPTTTKKKKKKKAALLDDEDELLLDEDDLDFDLDDEYDDYDDYDEDEEDEDEDEDEDDDLDILDDDEYDDDDDLLDDDEYDLDDDLDIELDEDEEE